MHYSKASTANINQSTSLPAIILPTFSRHRTLLLRQHGNPKIKMISNSTLTPPSVEWSSGSLLVSPIPSIIPSPISSPMIPLTVQSPVASPTTAEIEGFLTELGARVKMQGGLIRDHTLRLEELSLALFERYDRDIGELFTRSGVVRDEIFS
nr:hypothetical protein [Tanacetum cinerariifolium]